jgi:hypothetical protein
MQIKCFIAASRNYFRNVVSTVVLWSRFLFSICYAHVLLSVFLWSRFLFSICYAHVLLSVVLWSRFLFSICYAHVLLSVVWRSRFLFSICYAHVLLSVFLLHVTVLLSNNIRYNDYNGIYFPTSVFLSESCHYHQI